MFTTEDTEELHLCSLTPVKGKDNKGFHGVSRALMSFPAKAGVRKNTE